MNIKGLRNYPLLLLQISYMCVHQSSLTLSLPLLYYLKAGSQYDTEPCVALRNCEHCAMVKTRCNTKERKNRPGFYSSVVTRGLDATHRNAGPCVYCEPAFSCSPSSFWLLHFPPLLLPPAVIVIIAHLFDRGSLFLGWARLTGE